MNRGFRSCRTHLAALLALVAALGAAWEASAETLPAKGRLDTRIRTATYSEEEVYRLNGLIGYAIELIFEPGETYSGKAGGDLEGVTIDSHANSVLLKPRAEIVATNLVIYTNRRAYRFDYSVMARRPNQDSRDLMFAVRFLYPPAPTEIAGPNPEQQVAFEIERARTQRPRNTDYWYCGHRALRPVVASDDGVHTRLTFSDRAELPAVFVRNEDDTESLLNFSMDGGDVVIHRLAPRLILRRGRLTGCIVNKGFDGAGVRLESGTLSPRIERERKAPQP